MPWDARELCKRKVVFVYVLLLGEVVLKLAHS